MNREMLLFDRPNELAAQMPPEDRIGRRDHVRLLVTENGQHRHTRFDKLADCLQPGDLIVVNRSATLAASLPASGQIGPFILNLSTRYGPRLWLAEPRWSHAEPGPLPIKSGEMFEVGGIRGRLVSPFPGIERLWFVAFESPVDPVIACCGSAIRYGYVETPYPLSNYQTIFSQVPGSAEMPSAARPFTPKVLSRLKQAGINIADIVLHTGVSSLEIESSDVSQHHMYPEPYVVPEVTAQRVNATHRSGNRVIAIGTTVVRALESAWNGSGVKASSGFTQLYIQPDRGLNVVDGLLTGLHDPVTSHLLMLYALTGREVIHDAYREAVAEGYLWHEFGDSHLILAGRPADESIHSRFIHFPQKDGVARLPSPDSLP